MESLPRLSKGTIGVKIFMLSFGSPVGKTVRLKSQQFILYFLTEITSLVME
jgi:hypothetical protein